MQPIDTASNDTSRNKSKPIEKGGRAELESRYTSRRPGDGKQARFVSSSCSRVLFRRRRFYSKRLLLGALASEAARQLTFSG